jgi:hypothetical protein
MEERMNNPINQKARRNPNQTKEERGLQNPLDRNLVSPRLRRSNPDQPKAREQSRSKISPRKDRRKPDQPKAKNSRFAKRKERRKSDQPKAINPRKRRSNPDQPKVGASKTPI